MALRRYSRDHTWAERKGDSLFVGLTTHAIERLGQIRHLHLAVTPEQLLSPGEVFGSVESDRAVVDLYTPVGGRVVALHDDLTRDPSSLHDDCYDAGWLVHLTPTESSEFSTLLDAAAYNELPPPPHFFLRSRSGLHA
jgi:glycine cleavage system H protein